MEKKKKEKKRPKVRTNGLLGLINNKKGGG